MRDIPRIRGGCSGRFLEFLALDVVGASRLRGKAAPGKLRYPFTCLEAVGIASQCVMRFAFFSALRARNRLDFTYLCLNTAIRPEPRQRWSCCHVSGFRFACAGGALPGQFNCLHYIPLSVQKRPRRPPINARGTAGAFLNTDRKGDYMQKTIFLNCPHCRAG